MRPLIGRPFPVRFTDRLRRLNQKTTANAWKSAIIARLLDISPAISDYGLAQLTGDAVPLEELVADNERLAEHIRNNIAGTFHVSGTCRMGRTIPMRSSTLPVACAASKACAWRTLP